MPKSLFRHLSLISGFESGRARHRAAALARPGHDGAVGGDAPARRRLHRATARHAQSRVGSFLCEKEEATLFFWQPSSRPARRVRRPQECRFVFPSRHSHQRSRFLRLRFGHDGKWFSRATLTRARARARALDRDQRLVSLDHSVKIQIRNS